MARRLGGVGGPVDVAAGASTASTTRRAARAGRPSPGPERAGRVTQAVGVLQAGERVAAGGRHQVVALRTAARRRSSRRSRSARPRNVTGVGSTVGSRSRSPPDGPGPRPGGGQRAAGPRAGPDPRGARGRRGRPPTTVWTPAAIHSSSRSSAMATDTPGSFTQNVPPNPQHRSAPGALDHRDARLGQQPAGLLLDAELPQAVAAVVHGDGRRRGRRRRRRAATGRRGRSASSTTRAATARAAASSDVPAKTSGQWCCIIVAHEPDGTTIGPSVRRSARSVARGHAAGRRGEPGVPGRLTAARRAVGGPRVRRRPPPPRGPHTLRPAPAAAARRGRSGRRRPRRQRLDMRPTLDEPAHRIRGMRSRSHVGGDIHHPGPLRRSRGRG